MCPLRPLSFEGGGGFRDHRDELVRHSPAQPMRQGWWPEWQQAPVRSGSSFTSVIKDDLEQVLEGPHKHSILYNVHFPPFEQRIQRSKVDRKIQCHAVEPDRLTLQRVCRKAKTLLGNNGLGTKATSRPEHLQSGCNEELGTNSPTEQSRESTKGPALTWKRYLQHGWITGPWGKDGLLNRWSGATTYPHRKRWN